MFSESTFKVTGPLVPPSDNPLPATTEVISPVAEEVIVNVPLASSYDNDMPDPAVNKALTLSSTRSSV